MPRCPGSCSNLVCRTSAGNLSLNVRAGGATALTVIVGGRLASQSGHRNRPAQSITGGLAPSYRR
eukprot:4785897-Prorocentrum_lima.AAC.1